MSVSITKQSITLAFFGLLEKKPYSKITVSDITTEAGVNRMTFYYHFKDVDDLVLKNIEEFFIDICKKSVLLGDYTSAYLNVYLAVLRHKDIAKKIYPEFDIRRLTSFLSSLAFKLASYSVKQRASNKISEKMRDTVIHSVACCMVGSFIEWLNGDMQRDPHEIVKGQAAFFDSAIDSVTKKK